MKAERGGERFRGVVICRQVCICQENALFGGVLLSLSLSLLRNSRREKPFTVRYFVSPSPQRCDVREIAFHAAVALKHWRSGGTLRSCKAIQCRSRADGFMPHAVSSQCHTGWLNFGFQSPERPQQLVGPFDAQTHLVSITLQGQPRVRRIVRGRERTWAERPGTVHFLPADGEKHVFVTDADRQFAFHVFFIPPECLAASVEVDSAAAVRDLRELVLDDDAELTRSMRCLVAPVAAGDCDLALRKADAGRCLLRRLAHLAGGCIPDWYGDRSVFDHQTMHALCERIDAQLRLPPGLEAMACQVGLSPSHFARKFTQTTGYSLLRFVNARRVQKSLTLLKLRETCIVELAIDLGFSSQSHFTHVFHQHTGMTPARYQRFCMASIG